MSEKHDQEYVSGGPRCGRPSSLAEEFARSPREDAGVMLAFFVASARAPEPPCRHEPPRTPHRRGMI